MTCRAYDDGYHLLAMHDSSGRRGLWVRVASDEIELCSGREGDDAYVKLKLGDEITADTMQDLDDVFAYAISAAMNIVWKEPE